MFRNPTAAFLSLTLPLSALVLSCVGEEGTHPEPEVSDSFRGLHANGLQLHWTFEDRDGSQILDISGHGHHGTVNGGSFVSSPWGDAITLDGIDDYVSFVGPRDEDLYGGEDDGVFTMHMLVRVDDAGRYNAVCTGCAPMTALSIGTSTFGDRLYAALYNKATTLKTWPMSSNPSLSDNTWTHVTMVVEAGVGTKYYIDCELDSTVANSDVGLHDFGFSALGMGWDVNSWYNGEVDDLRVWNRLLSGSELENLCTEPVESACDGAPEAATLEIGLPAAPAMDTVPSSGIVWVDNTTDLQAEVTLGTPIIGLDPGTYTATGLTDDYLKITGQQLWASPSGPVVLEFGIDAGGGNSMLHPGSQLHGLIFDVDDVDNVPYWGGGADGPGTAIISSWYEGTDLLIEGCVLDGNVVVDTGIYVAAPDGLVISDTEVENLRHYGILVANYSATITTEPSLSDIRVEHVRDPGSPDVGVGIELGNTADVSNIRIRDVRWAGLIINGVSDGTDVSYVDIDQIGVGYTSGGGVGVYFDNIAKDTNVTNFCVGPNTRTGVNSEWDNNTFARGVDNVVEYGLIEASFIGVHFDQGTTNGNVNHVTFRNYSRAGITFHQNTVSGTWPTYSTAGSSQSNNTFEVTESNCTVCDLTYTHWNPLYNDPQCAGQSAC